MNILMQKDWSTLRKLLFLKGAAGESLTEYTETGNSVEFETNVAKALSGLTAAFSPIQSGSGDPSPSNVRSISGWTGVTIGHSGRNLLNLDRTVGDGGDFSNATKRILDCSKYYLGLSGTNYYQANKVSSYSIANGTIKVTVTDASYGMAFPIPVVAGEKYYIHCKIADDYTDTRLRYNFYKKDGTYLSNGTITPSNRECNKEITIPDETAMMCVIFTSPANTERTYSEICVNLSDSNFNGQYEEPKAFTSIPITFPAMGKNLFDSSTVISGTLDTNGKYASNASRTVSGYIPLKAGTYAISRKNTASINYWKAFSYTSTEGVAGKPIFNIDAASLSYTFTLADDCYIRVAFDYIVSSEDEIQLESGSTDTTYEPYTNTVYGGYVDLVAGELVVEWVSNKLSGLAWNPYSTGVWYNSTIGIRDVTKLPFCDKMTISTSGNWPQQPNGTLVFLTNKDRQVYVKKEAESKNAFLEWLEELDPTTVICLATPITYPLTPQQITTLIGDNVLWSDANEDMEVKYYKKG